MIDGNSAVALDRHTRHTPWPDRFLTLAALATVLAVLAPILVVMLSWGSDQTETWQHLIATQLSGLLRNTLVLLVGVSVGVALLGVSLAWLTVMCEFPGRRWLDWGLMLPMAVPAYVLAFVALGLLDFAGPLQQGLRGWLGPGFQVVDIRGDFTVIAVLVLVLYPYVYMLARSAFLAQGSDVLEAARVLGCNSYGAFFRVALPMARPAIVAGVSLAAMETLADFGAVAIFNYDTFTTAIYKAWFGLFNLQAAAQLASLLLIFVAFVLYLERYSRGRSRYTQGARLQHLHRYPLRGGLGWAALAYAGTVMLLAFVIPLLQLLVWALDDRAALLGGRFLMLTGHTLLLAGLGVVLTLLLALVMALGQRRSRGVLHSFFGIARLGYALPGSVLAVGVVLSFAQLDHWLVVPVQEWLGVARPTLLVGSVLALLAAYWVRFLAVASGPLDAALDRIRPSIPEAARSLGARGRELWWRIYLPMLRPGLLTAGVLVFVDIMKEMPATLLLRPFGWDTLAVRIYELTSEGEWKRAALPALVLVLVGLGPVIIALRRSAQR
ncbi:MAG: iron ABC transporter permease [Spongiibacteraceae bacterium]|nr:iron ABC transporter permease [Spongiibacteraceae bacterium]